MSARPVAIVTGAGRGIGRAVAAALATKGFDLCVADINADSTEKLCTELASIGVSAIACNADIADLASHSQLVEQTADTFGRIDCLVNNAGIGAPVRGDVLDLAPENFDRVLSVNLRGTVFLSQAVARWMLSNAASTPRSIITVTSVSAALASPERLDYCVSKAGLAMFVQGLALRLAPEGIGVFDVRPGIIRTEMTAGVASRYDRLIEDGLVPARRWGEAEDVAGVVASLASGAFTYATGSIIEVGGGLGIPRL
jgi:NAD(P)-dependent dehydrogenase (short-subunit alcohol dehydrogenase family)